MGIRFTCPNGHKLNVKEFLAGKRGVCPRCGAKFVIPAAQEANGGIATALPAEAVAPSAGPLFSRDAQRSAAADSPSVLIPLVEPPSPPVLPPAATSPPPPAAPPAVDVAVIPSVPPARPISNYAMRRVRNRRLQMQIAVTLLLAVIVLAVVLIWVLRRGPTETTTWLHNPTHLAPAPPQAYVAGAVLSS